MTSPVSRERLDAIRALPRNVIDTGAEWSHDLLAAAAYALDANDRIAALRVLCERDHGSGVYAEAVLAILDGGNETLAEAVVAAREARRVVAERRANDRITALEAERDALAQRVAAVRALHRSSQLGAVCIECDAAYPCPTVALTREDA